VIGGNGHAVACRHEERDMDRKDEATILLALPDLLRLKHPLMVFLSKQ